MIELDKELSTFQNRTERIPPFKSPSPNDLDCQQHLEISDELSYRKQITTTERCSNKLPIICFIQGPGHRVSGLQKES